ncbi:Retrovirus-related Pol polyprotein from transposon TNT 1-94 [Senna tora]|uniref:Retrovirus-related Pol polyprotein from transposon TNT 1-94 n=1 Tax=Senna tora TaxID=362788 RepID=A0A834WLI6_9FABA|nr:Retrovirus-related Pol polyprotein from transposon TNT 1-94 [Senna tora]
MSDGFFRVQLQDNTSYDTMHASSSIGIKRCATNENSSMLWHRSLGHISLERVKRLVKEGVLNALDFNTCIDCIKGKQTNKTKKGAKRSSSLLEIIHTDICSPDMDSKVEKQCDKQIKIVRSDRGGEYYGRYTEDGQAPGPFASGSDQTWNLDSENDHIETRTPTSIDPVVQQPQEPVIQPVEDDPDSTLRRSTKLRSTSSLSESFLCVVPYLADVMGLARFTMANGLEDLYKTTPISCFVTFNARIMSLNHERTKASKQMTPQEVKAFVEARKLLHEHPFQPNRRFPFYQQINDSGLEGLLKPRSEGNVAFIKDFYYQEKLYGKVDRLTFREIHILEIDPKDIKELYKLPDHPKCAYAAGEKDNSLVPYKEIEKTLCIAGKGWEPRTSETSQIYIYKSSLNNNAWIWLHFVSNNIMPTSHSRDNLYQKEARSTEQAERVNVPQEEGHKRTLGILPKRNQLQLVEAELITLTEALPPYFTKPYAAAPEDIPSSSRVSKETMVIPDSKDEDEEMDDAESKDF